MSIIKPDYMKPAKESKKKNEVDWSGQEPALIVNRQQIMKDKEIKKEVQQKIDKKKSIMETTSDEDYQELFIVVNNLILTKDFWEIVPDSTLQTVYAYIMIEMKTKGISIPTLPHIKEK